MNKTFKHNSQTIRSDFKLKRLSIDWLFFDKTLINKEGVDFQLENIKCISTKVWNFHFVLTGLQIY